MAPATGWSGSSVRLAMAVGVVVLGLGLAIVGSSLPARTISTSGVNRPVAGETAPAQGSNSPTLVRSPVNPANLTVVNRVDSPQYSCAMHVSVDGGRRWRETAIPFPAGEEAPPRCFAPDASYGGDGTLYVVFVTLKGRGNSPNAAWLSSSRDGGRTLSVPTRLLDRYAFQLRVLADPGVRGRVYVSWLQAANVTLAAFPDTGYPIQVTRSDDAGATWQPPVRVSPLTRARVLAPSMAAGSNGRLYVLYVDVGEDKLDYHGAHEWRGGDPYDGAFTLVLARTDDGGVTWKEAVVDAFVRPTQRFLVFLPPSPSLAVDPRRGRVYVGFADRRLGDADVWVRTSTDGGTSFGPRHRVNDTRRADATSQYLPKLATAPDGRLDVAYYDRRADRGDVMNEVSLQSSFDGGRTFGPRQRLSNRAFDSRIGFGSSRGLPDLGSRLGLVAGDGRAVAVWSDTRSGTAASGRQDLAVAEVTFERGHGLRSPLRALGRTLAVVGMVLLVGTVAVEAGRRRDVPA